MGVTTSAHADHLLPLVAASPASAGTRWLVVHLPAFRLERCGWQADEPVVLVAERQNATRVVALTPAARRAGLREGMAVAEARALVPGILVEPLDDPGEARDRADLARAFERFGDRVQPWGHDALLLEVSTTCRAFGGEAAMLARVREYAQELGHRCRLAIADHPLAAGALARFGQDDVVAPPGQGARALAPLPVQALEPGPALAESLAALGIRTVGAWARLEPASVAGRFGAEGVELHRVARGGAGGPWLDRPALPPLEPLRLPLDADVAQADGLTLPLRHLLERLREQLTARDLVAAHLELCLELAWGAPVGLGLRVTSPTRDPGLLERLLGSRLERVTLEAPVTGLVLHASEVLPDGDTQQDLLDRRGQQGAWDELLARLGDVLGDDAVVEASPADAWRPEAAWSAGGCQGSSSPQARRDDPVEGQEGLAWREPRPRPTLLRHPPLPLRVQEDAERPVAVRSREGWRPIRRARGPERLEGEWWRPDGGFLRAYWVVALPEGTAWIFRERGQWFLHGWFD